MKINLKQKKLYVFDVDGTLAISKIAMAPVMAGVLLELLNQYQVAVISGTDFNRFKKDLIAPLIAVGGRAKQFKNFFLFPTCGAAFYKFENGVWNIVYEHVLTEDEKKKIYTAFDQAFKQLHYRHPKKIYGAAPIECRRTQVAFAPLGQSAPVAAKEAWAKINNPLRLKICALLQELLPEFEVRIGGITTIDINRKGIDKAYGIKQMEFHLGIPKEEMIYFGDLFMPGGNDYPVKQLGIACIEVHNTEETRTIIEKIIHE